jgi:CubicO group peptidase (beta-lactamase class C family)
MARLDYPRRAWICARPILGAFVASTCCAGAALAGIVETTVELPVEVADVRGRIVRQNIKVTIYRDDQRAKSRFLILNHGRSGEASKRQAVRPAQYAESARYLVERGFAVLFLLRVGYGSTGGPDIENSGPCNDKTYPPGFEAAARQSTVAIEYAKTLPYVDRGAGLVMGQSFGGTTAIALAAKAVPGVLAAVNFAGGGGGGPKTHPGQPCGMERMKELFASYGTTARIATLWFYSENDRYWGPTIPRAWFEAFTGSGGRGQFVQLPPVEPDGHLSFSRNTAAWRPVFEEFLASCCNEDRNRHSKAAAPEPSLSDTPEAFTQVLAAWAKKHKVRRAVVVVRRNGRIVHRGRVGGGNPDAAYHLASLSKAITGACIATLVRDGKLAFATPLAKALAKFVKAHGKPADPRIAQVTIGQLLSHRAGFSSGDDGDDAATGTNLKAYLADHSPRDLPRPDYLASVLKMKLAHEPGERFAYSNAGFLVLGAAIEEATGRPYEDYCRGAVLTPVGAAGELEPTWRVMSSYGGWRMTGADYLAFLEQFDPAAARFGPRTRDWMLDRKGKTYGTASFPVWYGPGVRLRDAGNGVEIWHTGSFRRRLPPDAQGPLSIETSTLAIRIADGTSWFVSNTPLVLGSARAELYRDLLRAYRAVRNWR